MATGLPRWIDRRHVAVYLFLHLPILVLVVFSFNDSKFSVDWTGFTLNWYHRLLERPDIIARAQGEPDRGRRVHRRSPRCWGP